MATDTLSRAAGIRRLTVIRLWQVAILVVLIGGWQLWSQHSKYIKEIFGSPLNVVKVLWHWATGPNSHWNDLWSTVQGALYGFALGTAAAVVLTLVFVSVPVLGKLFAPHIAAFNAIPKVVLAPLFILWFGLGLESKALLVACVIFIIVFYNMYLGVRSIDQLYFTHVHVLGAGRLWEMRSVYLPAMMGWIVVSLRISVAFALLSAVVAEFLGSNQGIGHLISAGQAVLDPSSVLAGVVVIALLTVIIDSALQVAEARLTPWRP